MKRMQQELRRGLAGMPVEALLAELVAIPSHPAAPGAEGPIAEYIADFFRSSGMEAELREAEPGRPNVIGRLRGSGSGRTLVLCGHLDTVPPYGMRSPFLPRVEGGRLYGRGAVDMKAGLAAAMLAMRAIAASDICLDGDVLFAGVADEEMGSAGARALVSTSGFTADGAIVGEPTGLAVCLGHRGLEWFRVDFEGRTVHGGDQDKGINAIDHAARFIVDLREELARKLRDRVHPLLGPSTINVGKIIGGTQPSTVAGSCSVYLDRRFLPTEDYDEVVAELSSFVERRVNDEPGLTAGLRIMEESVMPDGFVHQPALVAPEHPLAAACADAMRALRDGQSADDEPRAAATRTGPVRLDAARPEADGTFSTFPAWSDAGILSHYGRIPSVVWGPGALQSAHSDEEHVELAQVADCALAYALAAASFCGVP